MLALDPGVFHREAHVVTVKEAIAWSGVWLAMGLAFAVFVYFTYEGQWFGLSTVAEDLTAILKAEYPVSYTSTRTLT